MNDRQRLLFSVLETLESYGYTCSEICFSGNTCLDLFAKKGDKLLVVKVVSNIDSVTPSQAEEMLRISSMLKASPVIVGIRKRVGELENGVAYYRHGVYAINLNTFTRALEGEMPHAESRRGGYYAEVCAQRLKYFRQNLGLSRREVAERAGITTKMLYEYERGKSVPKLSIARRLQRILNTEIIKGVNIFEIPEIDKKPDVKQPIFEKFQKLGMEVLPLKKAPFSGLLKAEELLVTKRFFTKYRRDKLHLLRSISSTLRCRGFIISRLKEKNLEGLPNIREKEIEKIESREELVDIIEARSCE